MRLLDNLHTRKQHNLDAKTWDDDNEGNEIYLQKKWGVGWLRLSNLNKGQD